MTDCQTQLPVSCHKNTTHKLCSLIRVISHLCQSPQKLQFNFDDISAYSIWLYIGYMHRPLAVICLSHLRTFSQLPRTRCYFFPASQNKMLLSSSASQNKMLHHIYSGWQVKPRINHTRQISFQTVVTIIRNSSCHNLVAKPKTNLQGDNPTSIGTCTQQL